MGMALMGLTHCRKCSKPLASFEYDICSVCRNKEQLEKEREREKKKEIERKRLERVLEIFDDMSDDDIVVFKQLIKKLGNKNKRKKLQQQINELQQQISNIDKE